jgi:uncharacterized protein YqjF (DUF2071 family)
MNETCFERVGLKPGEPWLWSQGWLDAIFGHWQAPIDVIERNLPPGLEVDSFEGQAWVTVIPFRMSGVRPRWLPSVAPISEFLELNFRTYVTYRGNPGIYLMSVNANKRAVVRLSTLLSPVPYKYLPLRFDKTQQGGQYYNDTERIDGSRFAFSARYSAGKTLGPAVEGTLDHWLLERYRLYLADARGRLRLVDVRHPPWTVRQATISFDVESLARRFGFDLSRVPDRVHFSPGVVAYTSQFKFVETQRE